MHRQETSRSTCQEWGKAARALARAALKFGYISFLLWKVSRRSARLCFFKWSIQTLSTPLSNSSGSLSVMSMSIHSWILLISVSGCRLKNGLIVPINSFSSQKFCERNLQTARLFRLWLPSYLFPLWNSYEAHVFISIPRIWYCLNGFSHRWHYRLMPPVKLFVKSELPYDLNWLVFFFKHQVLLFCLLRVAFCIDSQQICHKCCHQQFLSSRILNNYFLYYPWIYIQST